MKGARILQSMKSCLTDLTDIALMNPQKMLKFSMDPK